MSQQSEETPSQLVVPHLSTKLFITNDYSLQSVGVVAIIKLCKYDSQVEQIKPWFCSHLLLTQTAAAVCESQFLWQVLRTKVSKASQMHHNHNTKLWGENPYSRFKQLTFVLVKLVNESAHSIVPQLDDSVVQTCKNPWPLGMETEAWYVRPKESNVKCYSFLK